MNKHRWGVVGLADLVAMAPALANSLADPRAARGRASRRQLFRRVGWGAAVCAAALIGIAGLTVYQAPSTAAAAGDFSGPPSEMCEVLRPFGVNATDLEPELRQQEIFACKAPVPYRNDGTGWSDVSVAVYASAVDPGILREVLVEGRYPRGDHGATTKRRMLWAASAVCTRLGMEVPPEVASGIEHVTETEPQTGASSFQVMHHCENGRAGMKATCRIALRFRNATSSASRPSLSASSR